MGIHVKGYYRGKSVVKAYVRTPRAVKNFTPMNFTGLPSALRAKKAADRFINRTMVRGLRENAKADRAIIERLIEKKKKRGARKSAYK